MMHDACRIMGVFVGGPKTLYDARGEWRSSIARESVAGPAQLEKRGFVGDQATQPYHGSLETAVCLHSLAHYAFWNATLGLVLGPGSLGENLTLDTWDESTICVGDILAIGTARIQISAPRTPCENQARYVGRADWVKQTIAELRTGMYARVLTPGMLRADDPVLIEERPNPGLTVHDLNDCFYRNYNGGRAAQFLAADGLMDWWKQRLRDKGASATPKT